MQSHRMSARKRDPSPRWPHLRGSERNKSQPPFPSGNSQKKYSEKVEKNSHPKSTTHITTIHHQSTTNSPQIHHQKTSDFSQPPSKTQQNLEKPLPEKPP